jgi:hypothetical protein
MCITYRCRAPLIASPTAGGPAGSVATYAASEGCPIQVGTDMLFEQIPAYLKFFGFGSATPDDVRRRADRDLALIWGSGRCPGRDPSARPGDQLAPFVASAR